MELAQLLVRLGQLEAAETTLANTPLTKKAFVLAKVSTLQTSLIFFDKEIFLKFNQYILQSFKHNCYQVSIYKGNGF